MANYIIVGAVLALAVATSQGSAAISAASLPENSKPKIPPPALSAAAKEFLDAHNKARAAAGVAPLSWSRALGAAASKVAQSQRSEKKCEFASLNPGKYGANQLWAKGMGVAPRVVVEAWVKEKQFYDYGSNTCAASHMCGVYKQVVWRNSKELGCAQATCPQDSTHLTICFYNPPGNVVGEKPY